MHGEVQVRACAVLIGLQELVDALQATATAHLQVSTAAQNMLCLLCLLHTNSILNSIAD